MGRLGYITTKRQGFRRAMIPLGSKLNLWANSETVFANDDRKVSANDTIQSIEAWFDYMNEEFDKLYEIYT